MSGRRVVRYRGSSEFCGGGETVIRFINEGRSCSFRARLHLRLVQNGRTDGEKWPDGIMARTLGDKNKLF